MGGARMILLPSLRSHWRAHRAGLVLKDGLVGGAVVREWVGVAVLHYAWDRLEAGRPYWWLDRFANWILS
jgi:hypothetical protein